MCSSYYLSHKKLKVLPNSIAETSVWNFYCNNNELTSLKGSPETVLSTFSCMNNKLTNLEGAPRIVDSFYCSKNRLTSLENAPRIVGRGFFCEINKLTNFKGSPKITRGFLFCFRNRLVSADFLPIKYNRVFFTNAAF